MDPLTQGLLGAVTAQLGFRQRIGKSATCVAGLAAFTPDLDIFVPSLLSRIGVRHHSLTTPMIHRGLSHSLLMVPVIALACAGIWWWTRSKWKRKQKHDEAHKDAPGFGLLYACCFVAVLSHPILDWCTSYGTQLLAPLTNRRFAADTVPIIDIIYTPILLLTLIACCVLRKVLRSRAVRATLMVGWLGFLLSVGYLVTGKVMHDWAVNRGRELTGHTRIIRADAYPMLGTIFLWRAVVETDDNWIITRLHRFADTNPPPRINIVKKEKENTWIRKALELPESRSYEWFAMGRLRSEYRNIDGMHVVELHDMRYGWGIDSEKSLWPMRITFDPSGNLIEARRTRHGNRRGLKSFAGSIWKEIWNP